MITMPGIIAWEITRRCNLYCRHCRGASTATHHANELTTEAVFKTIAAITRVAHPMIILTGGEPLLRDDIFDIAKNASQHGCRVVMATCGHLLTPPIAVKLKSSGVMAVSISLDATTAAAHDAFRGVPGAYEASLKGIRCLRATGLPVQINTTVSKLNVEDLPRLLDQAAALGAAAIDFFFLVPTGRGQAIADLVLDAEARDKALCWIAEQENTRPLRIKVTCAPQYNSIRQSVPTDRPSPQGHGCMGGRGFAFLSHTGILQPCGFLDTPCGDIRSVNYDFPRLVRESSVFQNLQSRDPFSECLARARQSRH